MPILTVMVIAALLGRSRQSDSLTPLRSLTSGPIRVAHAIPGRVRFIVPSLRGIGTDGVAAIKRLESLGGFARVDVNTISGSLVVYYSPEKIDPPLLLGAVARLLGLEGELEHTPAPTVSRELRLLAQSINRAVFDKTHGLLDLWSITALVLIAIGGKKAMTEGWRSLPTGFTLLWWGLHSLPASENARA